MKRNRLKNVLSQRGAYLKKGIVSTRCRAKFVGLIYLLGIIALAAVVALMPLFDLTKQTLAPIGLMAFWQEFMPANLSTNLTTATGIVKLVNAALYGLMLIGVVINVLRGLGRLNWLFKRKASKTFGFNRNVYAMEDLGNIFSGSFAVILVAHFLMAVISGQLYPNMMMLVVVGGGVFVHLFAGFIGGKVAYYNVEDGELQEQRRLVKRFPALFRNVLQLAAVGAILYYFLMVCTLHTVIGPLMEIGGIQNYVLGQPMAYISIVCQVLTVIFVLPLIKHATATTEYNIDGAYGPGMKTFRVFSFFTLLSAGATAAARFLLGEIVFFFNGGVTSFTVAQLLDKGSIIIAIIAFVMLVIELIMRKAPGHKKDKEAKKAKKQAKKAKKQAKKEAKKAKKLAKKEKKAKKASEEFGFHSVNFNDGKSNYDPFQKAKFSAPAFEPVKKGNDIPPCHNINITAGKDREIINYIQPQPNPNSPYVNIPLSIHVDARDASSSTSAVPFPVPFPMMGAGMGTTSAPSHQEFTINNPPAVLSSTVVPPTIVNTPPVVNNIQPNEEIEEEETEVQEEVVEETFDVNCPICGKALRIKEGPTHYRCPSCGKVFQTRKVMKEINS